MKNIRMRRLILFKALMMVEGMAVVMVLATFKAIIMVSEVKGAAVVTLEAASTWPPYDSPAINCCLAGDVIILRPSRLVLRKISDA